MIAGTLALMADPSDEPLEPAGGDAFATLDVEETQAAFDDAVIQRGKACSKVEGRTEQIHVEGSHIDVEELTTTERVWTEWVADVTDAGFIAAERTRGSDPAFPFGMFRAITGSDVDPVEIDTLAFVEAQRNADRAPDIWFSGSKVETEDPEAANDAAMQYGREANQAGGGTGVGFRLPWRSVTVKGIVYESGYVAIYEDWSAVQFARFVRSEILPHASVPDEETEQAELPDGKEACDECGPTERDIVDYADGRYCVVCVSNFKDGETEAAP